MKKSYYFSHDYNARNDWKLVKVMMKHWVQWIWIYWCIVEILYECNGFLLLEECDRIAFELHTEKIIVESVISDFFLFQNDWKKFWSNSLNERLWQMNEKSEKARNSAISRWEKNKINTSPMRSYEDSNAIKIKENKINNFISKEITLEVFFENKKINSIFLEFIKNRTQMKKKVTPLAIERLVKKINWWMNKYEESQVIHFINSSIENWWIGIFEVFEKDWFKKTKPKLSTEIDRDNTTF